MCEIILQYKRAGTWLTNGRRSVRLLVLLLLLLSWFDRFFFFFMCVVNVSHCGLEVATYTLFFPSPPIACLTVCVGVFFVRSCDKDSRVVLHPHGPRGGSVRQARLQEPHRERPRASLRRQKNEQKAQELPR